MVISCNGNAKIMSITQFFHLWLWHASKEQVFVTLAVSSQIYHLKMTLWKAFGGRLTILWQFWRRFQKFDWRGSCCLGKTKFAPYFEGTKKVLKFCFVCVYWTSYTGGIKWYTRMYEGGAERPFSEEKIETNRTKNTDLWLQFYLMFKNT